MLTPHMERPETRLQRLLEKKQRKAQMRQERGKLRKHARQARTQWRIASGGLVAMAALDQADTGMGLGLLLEGVPHLQDQRTHQHWKARGDQVLAARAAAQLVRRIQAPVDGAGCSAPQTMAQGAGTVGES